MKTDELKLRIVTYGNNLVDMCIPDSNIFDKFKNATAKYWISQNAGKLDDILKVFADSEGNIDTTTIKNHYYSTLFKDGTFELDLRSIIPDDMSIIKSVVPDKIIVFNEDDFNKIFS